MNDVTALSLRLSDDLDAQLNEEARQAGFSRSELARQALAEFLARREKERYMTEIVAAAKALAADPKAREEAREWDEACVDDGLDALIAEERAAGIDPEEKWWS